MMARKASIQTETRVTRRARAILRGSELLASIWMYQELSAWQPEVSCTATEIQALTSSCKVQHTFT